MRNGHILDCRCFVLVVEESADAIANYCQHVSSQWMHTVKLDSFCLGRCMDLVGQVPWQSTATKQSLDGLSWWCVDDILHGSFAVHRAALIFAVSCRAAADISSQHESGSRFVGRLGSQQLAEQKK